MFRLFASALAAGLLVIPAMPAPATKDKPTEEPVGPITPEQLSQSAKYLEQIAIGFHSYNKANHELPYNVQSKKGKPLLSWRVQLLPHIDQEALYKEFKLDEPWDSAHNKKLIAKIPKIYAPVRGRAEKGATFYQVFAGTYGLFQPASKFSIATIPDGSSNTFLCAEAAEPVIWTKPEDMEFNGDKVPALGGMFEGKFHAALGDGTVARWRRNVRPITLMQLINPNDGMPLPADLGLDPDDKD